MITYITQGNFDFIMKSLHFSANVFKKPYNRSKCLILLEKPHITLKKASISLEIPSKRIEIFAKASISLYYHEFFKKKPRILKKKESR
jgi:hypothetical protein